MVFKSRFADVKPDEKYKDLVSNFFWDKLDQFEASVLFVDYATRRHWTGAQIKTTSAKLARQLIRHGLRANDDCVMFYKHCDYIQLAALGILFAGGSVCAGYDVDPEQEHAYMLAVMRPSFVFVGRNHVKEMVRLRTVDKHNYKIVVMDDDGGDQATSGMENGHDNGGAILGLHQDLLAEPEAGVVLADASPSLPVQVDPQRPAFTLLTSGSTGRPKPACRSQRNSLYVCHSLIGAKELWDLSESSVVAAHLALDHGTGIFQLKQCLTHGYKSIIINGYEMASMLDAIETYRITDLVLGSALVHNLLSSSELLLHERLGSLRNLLAVGSPIASQSTVRHFMSLLPECSVRQAFGMTETGFLCVVPRELALRNPDLDTQIVGLAMPNVEFKLVTRKRGSGPTTAATKTTTTTLTGNQSLEVNPEAKEITEFDEQGELYVRAPTVSPGYLGEQFREQSRANFLPDGFYKSNDICSIGSDGLLRVHGRFSEVLCLSDGWKVLPSEIEHTIMEHPFVREAAVVGIPHPTLPTCHAPRAYIVPRDGVAIDDDAIDDDAKQNGHDDGDHHQANGTNKLNGCVEQAKCCSNGHSNNNNSYKLQNHNNLDTKLNGTCPSKAISKRLIFDFVAERLSEPKHLIGGIKFMSELPKISIGKVDKRSLKRADGY